MSERTLDLWAGLLIVLAGLAGLLYLIPAHIGDGFGFGLSPRFFPYLCIGATTALGALLLLNRLLSGAETRRIEFSRRHLGRLLLLVALLAGSLALIQWLGYLVGAAFLVAAFMLAMGEKRISRILPTATLWPLALWLLFKLALGAPLD
ncbi:tripartite tricarboxylate transporter TctB family protein [Halopseudomonas maritima]|uniref:tripartite tricarboxylate transporter TctB family protein n=1 Tax=Halopseudomonas maritima TaxID=2918528 RepID=UPI001EEB0252|nr:tripartite tricarboxylate transporter TctB family protein [Halopseudomonas maritima]UJJ32232.1 tripartite tricarboxylate transporter TctB family protein [Halopseudomonas maritima]